MASVLFLRCLGRSFVRKAAVFTFRDGCWITSGCCVSASIFTCGLGTDVSWKSSSSIGLKGLDEARNSCSADASYTGRGASHPGFVQCRSNLMDFGRSLWHLHPKNAVEGSPNQWVGNKEMRWFATKSKATVVQPTSSSQISMRHLTSYCLLRLSKTFLQATCLKCSF